jgi:hypothetical protein
MTTCIYFLSIVNSSIENVKHTITTFGLFLALIVIDLICEGDLYCVHLIQLNVYFPKATVGIMYHSTLLLHTRLFRHSGAISC